MMEIITIHDGGQGVQCSFLDFDLIDILSLFETKAIQSVWKVTGVEANHPSSRGVDEWDPYFRGINTVEGSELFRLASITYQTIDGYFWGYLPDQSSFWIMIRVVDSSFFVVASPDAEVMDQLRGRFHDVREGSPDEVYAPG